MYKNAVGTSWYNVIPANCLFDILLFITGCEGNVWEDDEFVFCWVAVIITGEGFTGVLAIDVV